MARKNAPAAHEITFQLWFSRDGVFQFLLQQLECAIARLRNNHKTLILSMKSSISFAQLEYSVGETVVCLGCPGH